MWLVGLKVFAIPRYCPAGGSNGDGKNFNSVGAIAPAKALENRA